jgi:predicted transposase/invertase (TIGR01784 family)
MAIKRLQETLADEQTRILEEARWKWRVAHGLELGAVRDLGREEGRQEGLQEGRERERLETARRMAARGFDPSVIEECTGLKPADWASHR